MLFVGGGSSGGGGDGGSVIILFVVMVIFIDSISSSYIAICVKIFEQIFFSFPR